METEEFNTLLKKKTRIENEITKKEAKIDALNKRIRQMIKKINKQRDDAIKAINERYDNKITILKQETKQRIFLLKDKKEFSADLANKVDDEICTSLESEPEANIVKDESKVEESDDAYIDNINIALKDFVFNIKNENTFKKQFNTLKNNLSKTSENFEKEFVAIEKLLMGNSKSKVTREEILKITKQIEEKIEQMRK